jgi:uncharacterized protein YjbJ (UPF0337 family)
MNKEQIKGKLNVVAGRAKRQAGEWTGSTEQKVEGAVQEVKGNVEIVIGKIEEAVDKANAESRPSKKEIEDAQPHRYEKE